MNICKDMMETLDKPGLMAAIKTVMIIVTQDG